MSQPEQPGSKRARIVPSCSNCKVRKVKCNKEHPCSNCSRRGEEATCYRGQEREYAAAPSAYASRADMVSLQSQVAHLQSVNGQIVSYLSTASDGNSSPALLALQVAVATSVESAAHDSDNQQEQADSETEAAALDLEYFAMGKSAEGPSQPASPENLPQATFSDRNNTKDFQSVLKRMPDQTTTQKGFHLAVPPATYTNLAERLCEYDISPARVNFLVDCYFSRAHFHWSVHHEPTFRTQVQLFLELVACGRLSEADPMFICCLFLVMSLAVNHTIQHQDIGIPLGLSDSEVAALPVSYFTASQIAFAHGGAADKPQVRIIQAVLMLSHYFFHNGQKEFTGELDGFHLHLSLAFRTATLLGLHRLEDNRSALLRNDIALPANSPIKIEVCKRLWNILLFTDSINENGQATMTVTPELLDKIVLPSNINDADIPLVTSTDYGLPMTIPTDQQIETGRYKLAVVHRRYFQRVDGSEHPLRYEEVIQFDRAYRSILDEIPTTLKTSFVSSANEPAKYRLQRIIVEQGVLHRLLRLHRNYVGKGYKDDKYRYSVDAAGQAAALVLSNHKAIVTAGICIDYFYAHLLTAHLVLFHDLFLATDFSQTDVPAKYSLVLEAVEVFRQAQYFVSSFAARLGHEAYALSQLLLQVYEQRSSLSSHGSADTTGQHASFSSLLKEFISLRAATSKRQQGAIRPAGAVSAPAQYAPWMAYTTESSNSHYDLLGNPSTSFLDNFFAPAVPLVDQANNYLGFFDSALDEIPLY